MCTHPFRAFPTGLKTENGKDDYFLSFTGDYVIPVSALHRSGRMLSHPLTEFIEVPCGNCYECKKEKARKWAFRCVFEASEYDENYFVTLTYDDAYLPADQARHVYDMQLFFKRLRKAGMEFRYFACGELGENTQRRHCHVLFFGLHLEDLKYFARAGKFSIFTSDQLSQIWGNGFVSVGYATPGYVGNYIAKYTIKQTHEKGFLLMSRKPGIGFNSMLKLLNEETPCGDAWKLLTIGDGRGNSLFGSLPRSLRERLELSPSDELTRAAQVTLLNKMKAAGYADWQIGNFYYIEHFRETEEYADKKKEVLRNLSKI